MGLAILESLNLKQRGLEIVSCPSCGRAQVDVYTRDVLGELATLPRDEDGPGRERLQAAVVLHTGGDWYRFKSMVELAPWTGGTHSSPPASSTTTGPGG